MTAAWLLTVGGRATLLASSCLLLVGSAVADRGAADPGIDLRPAEPERPLQGQGTEETEAEKMLRLAREGSAVVKPQAARRFVSMGAEAAEVLLRETGGEPAGLAEVGKDLVFHLAALDDARVRGLLWRALDDADFPWRPAAAAGLAATSEGAELERFLGLAGDRIAQVRAAALGALVSAEDKRAHAALVDGLSDVDERPRRAAADALAVRGERWALQWLWVELFRDERFFDRNTGRTARIEALRLLEKHMESVGGFDPTQPADGEDNIEPLLLIAEALSEDAQRKPNGVSAPEPLAEPDAGLSAGAPAVLGLELVSCRRGEFFLRVTGDDRLLVGLGRVRVATLPAGTAARLVALAQSETLAAEVATASGTARFFGQPGCDREVLHLDPSGDLADHRAWEVSKGAGAVPDLRPPALGRVLAALVRVLPEEGGLRGEVAEALVAVGGPLPDPPAAGGSEGRR